MGKKNSSSFWGESPDTDSKSSGMSDFELYGPDGVNHDIDWQVAEPEPTDEGPNEPLPDGSADVAQLVEQSLRKREVAGSNPAIGSMSRLEQQQSRTFHYLLAAFILLILGLGVSFAVFGVAPFINFAAGASTLVFGRQDNEVQTNTSGALSLNEHTPPNATSSATLALSGSVNNVDRVSVYLGGTRKKTLETKGKSEFSTTLTLAKGRNEIKFIAANDTERRESDVHVVFYLSEKPTITLETPTEESLTTLENNLSIKGAVDPTSVTVTINGGPVVVDADGTFQQSVRLKQGDNTITIKAVDEAGQETEKTLQVKREK